MDNDQHIETSSADSTLGWQSLIGPRWALIVVAALLVAHAVLAMSAVVSKSVTFDEILYLSSGYSYWETGDYRLQPESGILPQRWAALPLCVSDVRYPSLEQPAWWGSSGSNMAMQFFYGVGNDVEKMLWRGRSMMIVLSLVLGVAVYVWSRHLFGLGGGLISVVLYALSPTALAHGPLITSDIAMSAGVMISTGCLWTMMHHVNGRTLIASGVALGLLLVTKMSAVLVLPLALGLWGLREWLGQPLHVEGRQDTPVKSFDERLRYWGIAVAAQLFIALLVVWWFYGFRASTFKHAQQGRDRMDTSYAIRGMEEEGFVGAAVVLTNSLGILPQPYLQGFSKIVRRTKTRRSFLNGQYSRTGWKSFFPYCLLVKTPWPTLLFVAAAAGTLAWQSHRDPTDEGSNDTKPWTDVGRVMYHGAPLWAFFIIYWAMAIMSGINIGHRHLLPTYPIMFVFAGAVGYWLRPFQWRAALPIMALAGWLLAESFCCWPNYLAYFNRIAGGSAGAHRHLVDSSLDWGQDLPGLKRWLERERSRDNGNAAPAEVFVSYFGTGSLDYYGIDGHQLPSFAVWPDERVRYRPLTAGTYCISATMLQSIYLSPFGRWSERYEADYQRLLGQVPQFEQWQAREDFLDSSDEARQRRGLLKRFLELRFCRLCAFLRQRQPDDQVGYSILIYRLTAADVMQSLNGPPAELESSPAGQPSGEMPTVVSPSRELPVDDLSNDDLPP